MFTPKFTITQKLLKDIGTVEAARAVVDSVALLPAWEAKFQEEAEVRAMHYGTHIEGNELNMEEVKKLVEGKDIVARERDVREVINYRRVLDYLEAVSSEQLAVSGERNYSEGVLKELHKLTVEGIVPKEQVGDYRSVQVILRDVLTSEIVHRPPPAVEVPYLLKALFEWLNGAASKDLHPVLKAGIVHYQIVHIHPFTEGNGRVSRAMATLMLLLEGYDIRKLFSLEEYYDKNVASYYYALKTADQNPNHDLTQWLEYFVEGVAIEFNRVKEQVSHLSIDLKLKAQAGGHIFLNQRQIKIVEHIEKIGYLANAQFKDIVPMVSEDTVLRDLKDLMDKKILKKKGKTKAARYVMK